MKTYGAFCFFLSLAMIVLPVFSLDETMDKVFKDSATEKTENTEQQEATPQKNEDTVKIMSVCSNNITETSLREYLIGTIFGEIGSHYNEEAIKAQVVACHTMLIYSKKYKSDGLNGADISDSGKTHQEYMNTQKQKEKFGDKYDEARGKIEKCVDEVIDKVILYNGNIIMPAFSSMSNGKSENAENVWNGGYPYLVSVNSEGDKLAPDFISEVNISLEDFKNIIGKDKIEKDLEPQKYIGEIKNTETGMVKSITICGKEYKGTDIRKMFNLKSSTFTVAYGDGSFKFTVKGYGHGVGMSQNGANFLANQGMTYDEILKHYYTGVTIEDYKE